MRLYTRMLPLFIACAMLFTSLPLTHASASFTTPVASSFSTTVAANRQNAVQLQGFDAEGTSLSYATTSTPAHGTLSALNAATGVVVYQPVDNYVGSDSFTYTVTSGGETSAAGTVTLTVTNAKTRIIDSIDPAITPGASKITFILTQPTTSPSGLIPKGATVSAALNSAGQFDISVYPSRSLSPTAYYQVWIVDKNGGQTLHGIYDIPLSTVSINLAPYKVTDANLAAQYIFASQASVSGLTTAAATATMTTLLGISPTNNTLQKYNGTTGKFANSSITDTGTGVTVDAPATFTGSLTVTSATGDVTSGGLRLATTAKGMIANGVLPYSPDYLTDFTNFYDAKTLDLAEGEAVSSWPDLSGNGRHATQATSALRPIYHQTEAYNVTSDAYVSADADLTRYLTVPLAASSTRTFFMVVRNQSHHPFAYSLFLDANNWMGTLLGTSGHRFATYRSNLNTTSTPTGWGHQYHVLAWRQNSPTSTSFFVNGVLVDTYTTADSALASATSIKLGPGLGKTKLFAVMDKGRPLTNSEVADNSNMLIGHHSLNYEYTWIDRAGYAPTLASEGLIIRKRGLRGKRPVVILNHQAAATEGVFVDADEQRAIAHALADAGYIVAISRQWTATAFENSWGNSTAVQANVDLYAYVVANFPVDTNRVAMLGMSMGGISTMVAFSDGRIPLKGAACFDCVLDLRWAWDATNGGVNAGAFSAGINTAYNISGNYSTQTAGHDPRLLGTSPFSAKRFMFVRNSDDVIVDPNENTGDFRTQIAGVATESVVTTYTNGAGHLGNMSASKPLLLAFLARCFA